MKYLRLSVFGVISTLFFTLRCADASSFLEVTELGLNAENMRHDYETGSVTKEEVRDWLSHRVEYFLSKDVSEPKLAEAYLGVLGIFAFRVFSFEKDADLKTWMWAEFERILIPGQNKLDELCPSDAMTRSSSTFLTEELGG